MRLSVKLLTCINYKVVILLWTFINLCSLLLLIILNLNINNWLSSIYSVLKCLLYLQVYKKCATFASDKERISKTDVWKESLYPLWLIATKNIFARCCKRNNVFNICLRLRFDVSSTTILNQLITKSVLSFCSSVEKGVYYGKFKKNKFSKRR